MTEESLNTASVTNRSESWADFATNADFGLGADGVGGVGEPPHLQRANVFLFSLTEDPAVTAWATRTVHLLRRG